MRFKQYILLIISLLLIVACSTEDLSLAERLQQGPVKVGFWVGDSHDITRTQINDDGQYVSWSRQDSIALWAKNATGSFVLENQIFNQWFISADNSKAYFISDLGSPMTSGTYTYYACYPTPQSVSGTTATFSIPATQDGKISSGADIMVATPSQGDALKLQITPKDPNDEQSTGDYLVKDGLNLSMHHLGHALRFYIPQAHWGFGDEIVERIVFTMPADVAGTVTADVASPESGLTMTENRSNTISLNLVDPIGKSSADVSTGVVDYDFACATIMPGTYGGKLTAKVYSKTKAAQVEVPFNNRQMVAGHITPVGLNCSEVKDQYVLRFLWGGNNLGEDINAIYFYDGESHIYTIDDAALFKRLGYHDIDFSFEEDQSAFKALAGKTITVKYDSEHALVSNTFVMPAVNHPGLNEVTLTVPYLFFEDFSKIGDFTDDHDDAPISLNLDDITNLGDTYNNAKLLDDEDSHLVGWSGGHVGGSAGKAVRIMCRYQAGMTANAYYKGRIDTPAIGGLKKETKIRISFDYTSAYKYAFVDDGSLNTPIKMYMGYTTATGAIKPDTRGTNTSQTAPTNLSNKVIDGENLTLSSGSYDSGFQAHSPVIINSATAETRLSWIVSSDIKANFWGGNGNFWLYIDNIKVQIVP